MGFIRNNDNLQTSLIPFNLSGLPLLKATYIWLEPCPRTLWSWDVAITMATTGKDLNSLHIQIPVVDINGSDSEEHIADQLVNAATIYGFVYIKNLGQDILTGDIENAFDLVFLVCPIVDMLLAYR